MILMVNASYAFGDVYDNAGGGQLNLNVLAQNYDTEEIDKWHPFPLVEIIKAEEITQST